jgi:hypothetical protein
VRPDADGGRTEARGDLAVIEREVRAREVEVVMGGEAGGWDKVRLEVKDWIRYVVMELREGLMGVESQPRGAGSCE